jgi:ubiquinone/menaquinone biosynthesis C-methylase UbiE
MNLDPVQRAAQQQFSRQSHRYGSGHILENIEDVRSAADSIPLVPGSRVLDIAAANGHTGLFFAAQGHQVVLADISAAMLERAREAASARGLTVETREHAAEVLPYPDATFDLVTCRVAAHHFSSPEAFIAETARVLKPGGYFLLIDGSVEDHEEVAEAWIHQVEKLRDPSHARFLTPGAWRVLCKEAGLSVVSVELFPFKQPNLEWYFETAATSPENREKVRALIASAPEEARRLFGLTEEEGVTVWWWRRLTLIARKPAQG